jgi:hypothetical protein
MSRVLWLDLWKLTRKMQSRVIKWINIALENRVDFIERISPEASWDYVESHFIRKAEIKGWFISWWNANDSDHAVWVETWFRNSSVNWSKKDNVTIYNWVGANVMQRTTLNPRLKKETIAIITKTLAEW